MVPPQQSSASDVGLADYYSEVAEFRQAFGSDMLPEPWRGLGPEEKRALLDRELDLNRQEAPHAADAPCLPSWTQFWMACLGVTVSDD